MGKCREIAIPNGTQPFPFTLFFLGTVDIQKTLKVDDLGLESAAIISVKTFVLISLSWRSNQFNTYRSKSFS